MQDAITEKALRLRGQVAHFELAQRRRASATTRKCYELGGKECVIRAWACDAKG